MAPSSASVRAPGRAEEAADDPDEDDPAHERHVPRHARRHEKDPRADHRADHHAERLDRTEHPGQDHRLRGQASREIPSKRPLDASRKYRSAIRTDA